MPILIPAILKGVLFLLLFLTGLLLFLLLFLLSVPLRYRGNSVRGEKQLSGCFSVSWLFPLLRLSFSYAAEKKAEFFTPGFRVYHSDKTEDTASTAGENDFGYPESMASKDFEPGTVETTVVEQQKTITEQAEISSEYPEVTEPISNRKGVPPQKKDKQRRDISEEEQRAVRCRGRSRRCFRRQWDQISADTRKSQDSIRSAGTRFDFFQDERAQRFPRFLKQKVFRFSWGLLSWCISDTLHFDFADPALTGQEAALTATLLPLYRDNLEVEPLFDCEEPSGNLVFRG